MFANITLLFFLCDLFEQFKSKNINIPQIIHQIWSGIDEPLPTHFKMLGETWKYDYPDWKYEFWDNERMNGFIIEHYPQYWEKYN